MTSCTGGRIASCAPGGTRAFGRRVDEITPADVAELVASLSAAGKARETIRKTVTVLSMVLDHAGITPNPARDRIRVRLPREERPELSPPTAEHVEAVHRLLAPSYKLALRMLDATGMRVGELCALTWADVDEPRSRFRVSRAVAKTATAGSSPYRRCCSRPCSSSAHATTGCPNGGCSRA